MDKWHHILWATIFFLGIYILMGDIIFMDGPTVLISLLICILYALIPDLDLKSSWIKIQLNNIILYLIIILTLLFFATGEFNFIVISGILLVIEIILQLLKHRGILHSLLFGLLLTIPLYFINYPSANYLISGIIGIISHWIVDKF